LSRRQALRRRSARWQATFQGLIGAFCDTVEAEGHNLVTGDDENQRCSVQMSGRVITWRYFGVINREDEFWFTSDREWGYRDARGIDVVGHTTRAGIPNDFFMTGLWDEAYDRMLTYLRQEEIDLSQHSLFSSSA
jgi:hypothetical protein